MSAPDPDWTTARWRFRPGSAPGFPDGNILMQMELSDGSLVGYPASMWSGSDDLQRVCNLLNAAATPLNDAIVAMWTGTL